MASIAFLPIFPLILFPLFFAQPKTSYSLASLRAFYESLRELPYLSPNATPLDRFRHGCHRVYFNYLVTGPGYVLEPAERIFFDCFIMLLLGAIAWGMGMLCPLVVRAVQGRFLKGKEDAVMGIVGEEALWWNGNMSTVVGLMQDGKAVFVL